MSFRRNGGLEAEYTVRLEGYAEWLCPGSLSLQIETLRDAASMQEYRR